MLISEAAAKNPNVRLVAIAKDRGSSEAFARLYWPPPAEIYFDMAKEGMHSFSPMPAFILTHIYAFTLTHTHICIHSHLHPCMDSLSPTPIYAPTLT